MDKTSALRKACCINGRYLKIPQPWERLGSGISAGVLVSHPTGPECNEQTSTVVTGHGFSLTAFAAPLADPAVGVSRIFRVILHGRLGDVSSWPPAVLGRGEQAPALYSARFMTANTKLQVAASVLLSALH